MKQRVLITGGAGFIGSHLADQLLESGYGVRVLDCLIPQVHGDSGQPPAYLAKDVEFIHGDVRDRDAVRRALDGISAVVHLAAAVGVGQSMYEIEHYTSVNNIGTAVLLEALIDRPVERLVVASSMSVYGEGLYREHGGQLVHAAGRSSAQLKAGQWEPLGPDNQPLEPLPTPESKQPDLSSVYALSKYDQERLCLMTGRAYGIPSVALRFFNVFGTRQALSNPYTGVLAIFASRLLNGRAPLVFEDGEQRRDFVSVHDIARACRLALECPGVGGEVFNIGSGRPYTIREIAETLARVLGREDLSPEITGKYRVGDIRHCFADIAKARATLGFEPQVTLERGIEELAEWLAAQEAEDSVDAAFGELKKRGLAV
ncbi:MAG: NAD-dependent epimerase/dehydratase family protein [Sumerlaeia bacterium]